MLNRKIEIKPNMMGKCSTFFQMITLLALIASGLGFIPGDGFLYILFGTTVFFITVSTAIYVWTGISLYSEKNAYGN